MLKVKKCAWKIIAENKSKEELYTNKLRKCKYTCNGYNTTFCRDYTPKEEWQEEF